MQSDAEMTRLLTTLNPTAEGATIDATTIILRENPLGVCRFTKN